MKKTNFYFMKMANCFVVKPHKCLPRFLLATRLKVGVLLMIGLMTGHWAHAQWTQLGGDIDGEANRDNSGWSVSFSADGSRLAIGALYNNSATGHVRVYQWDGTQWVQLGMDIDGEAAGDLSGWSVSLSSDGSRLAIGAVQNTGAAGIYSGHVRVYGWNGSAWTQLGFDIDGEVATDYSGQSVSLSADGSRLAIGAPGNDGTAADAGHVRVYRWSGSAWTQLGMDINGEAAGDYSGWAVSLSANGSRLAIGALDNDGTGGTAANAGHVRVYQWDGTQWTQLGMDIDGEAAGDGLGYSVSFSADGSRLAIGAPYNSGNAGHARVYEWDGTSWGQLGLDIDGEAANDYSGWSVSLSSDGSRLAIGAQQNDGTASNAGHARVYEWDGTSWGQLGLDIDGEAAGDGSGYSVSLSSDGSRLAIGAPYNDDGATDDPGHVRIYEGFIRSSGEDIATPLPLMPAGQLLLWSLLLASLSVGAIRKWSVLSK